jgi:Alpha/beta hydrolase domain
VAERYPSKEGYLALAREQLAKLIKDGYLLAQDEAAVMQRVDAQWMLVSGQRVTNP